MKKHREVEKGKFVTEIYARANPNTTVAEKRLTRAEQRRVKFVLKPEYCKAHLRYFIYEQTRFVLRQYCAECEKGIE